MFKSTVSLGSHGDDVRRLQRVLSRLSHGQDLAVLADGFGAFGPHLDGAARAFQAGAGLDVDGIVGPVTWAALPPYAESPGAVKLGSVGPVVAGLQRWLTTFATAGIGPSPGPVDGYFGPITEGALEIRLAIGMIDDLMWLAPVQDGTGAVDSLEEHCHLIV